MDLLKNIKSKILKENNLVFLNKKSKKKRKFNNRKMIVQIFEFNLIN